MLGIRPVSTLPVCVLPQHAPTFHDGGAGPLPWGDPRREKTKPTYPPWFKKRLIAKIRGTASWAVSKWNATWKRYLLLVDNALLKGNMELAVAEDEAFDQVVKESKRDLLVSVGTN